MVRLLPDGSATTTVILALTFLPAFRAPAAAFLAFLGILSFVVGYTMEVYDSGFDRRDDAGRGDR